MAKNASAQMLQAMLRYKRSQLCREEVGLSPRIGARGGLTQEDLAELTGYTTRVIADLEHNKLRTPSRPLLDAVARGLALSPDERRTLWLLAAGSMPPSGAYATGPDAGLTQVVEQLYPHPAYVTDAAWNIVAYNRAVTEWFQDFADLPEPDRNIAKWIFCYPHSQHVFVEWERDFAGLFLSRLRAMAAQLPDNEPLNALVAELQERSEFVRRTWNAEATVYTDPPSEIRVFRRPGFTDPAQVDDDTFRVPIRMAILVPIRPDDQRRLVTFLLPDHEPHRPDVLSATACPVCRRT